MVCTGLFVHAIFKIHTNFNVFKKYSHILKRLYLRLYLFLDLIYFCNTKVLMFSRIVYITLHLFHFMV